MVELQIQDNGVGMDQHVLKKLFDMNVSYSKNGTAVKRYGIRSIAL